MDEERDDVMDGISDEQMKAAVDKEDEKVKCPCCGKLMDKAEVNFDNDVTDLFLTCMMTGEPFVHTYPLYGGRMSVTVRRLPRDVVDTVRSVDDMLQRADSRGWKDGRFPNIPDLITRLRVLSCVMELSIRSGVGRRTYKPAELVDGVLGALSDWTLTEFGNEPPEGFDKVIGDALSRLESPQLVSSVPVDVLVNVVVAHNRLYGVLLDLSMDRNFWDGIGLA